MQIAGLIKLTLLDYPGKLACTIFTPGCQLRCPFCHNAQFALTNPNGPTELDVAQILTYLQKRAKILEGVCISGGEPLMQDGIEEFIIEIKKLGYSVKLDTNGGFPDQLKNLLELKLIDYVAMDIKNCPSQYAETCGQEKLDLSPFERSIRVLQKSKTPYEFRSTIVREFHSKENILQLNEWNIGSSQLFLQSFKDSGNIISSGLHSYNAKEMEDLRQSILHLLPNTLVRNSI